MDTARRPVLACGVMADLSTKDVAARFGVDAPAVRQWCRRGLFPNAYEEQQERGTVWKIPEGDLDGFERPKKTGRPPKQKAARRPRNKR